MSRRSTSNSLPRLTGGLFAPITDQILLLEGLPEDLAKSFCELELGRRPAANLELLEVAGPLQSQLDALLPIRSPLPNRWLFVPTNREGITAVFNNAPHPGAGAATGQLSWLAKEAVGLRFDVAAPQGSPEYNLYWRPFGTGRPRRCLRFLHDGDRYTLQEDGEPWPFEDLAAYRKRGRHKLTAAMLHEYVKELGLAWVWDEQNYAPDKTGILVTSDFDNSNFTDIPFDTFHDRWESILAGGKGLL